MTNSSPQTPPPSPEEQRLRQQIRNRVRQETTDEWIAILVAFGTIGAILLWSLGFRRDNTLANKLNIDTLYSVDRIENDQELETPVLIPLNTLETATTDNVLEEKRLSLDDDIYTIDGESANFGTDNALIVGAPLIGAVRPKVVTPEEPEAVVPEPEVVTPEEPEAVTPEPEATAPEPEPEPEVIASEPETTVSFSDVTEEYWAYPFLQKLGEQQLISPTSDNQFEPDALITRAGMATLISQAFDQPQTKDIKDFKDIDNQNIIARDINEAVATGFMKGYSDDEFRPAENIPRYQVLVALATGLDLKPSGDPVTILQDFSGRDEIPNWAISQVAAATEAGLTVNRPEFDLQSLRPQEPATRAEVAAMIYQTLGQLDKVESIDSEYIVPQP